MPYKDESYPALIAALRVGVGYLAKADASGLSLAAKIKPNELPTVLDRVAQVLRRGFALSHLETQLRVVANSPSDSHRFKTDAEVMDTRRAGRTAPVDPTLPPGTVARASKMKPLKAGDLLDAANLEAAKRRNGGSNG